MKAVLVALLSLGAAAGCSDGAADACGCTEPHTFCSLGACAPCGAPDEACCPDVTCMNGGCCTTQGTCVSDGARCGDSDLVCVAGLCLSAGGEGLPCRYEAPACDEGLTCVDGVGDLAPNPHEFPTLEPYQCVRAGGLRQPCWPDGSCDDDLLCSTAAECEAFRPCCTAPGGELAPCFEDGTCSPGLVCIESADQCGSEAPCCFVTRECADVGLRCADYPDDFYCAEPPPGVCPGGVSKCCLPFPAGTSQPCFAYGTCSTSSAYARRCLAEPAIACPYDLAECCVEAGHAGEPCVDYGVCLGRLACMTRPAGECPYGLDSCCSVAEACGPDDSCDVGMACLTSISFCPQGESDCCVPVGGAHEPCLADGTCDSGLACVQHGDFTNLANWCQNSWSECCLPGGGDGQACLPGATCAPGLRCVAAADSGVCPDYFCCTRAGGLDQPCSADGTCDAPLACVADPACPTWLTTCCR